MTTMQRTLLAILFACTPAFAADSIAFITNLKGEVAVDGVPRPMLLAELVKGQKLTVGRDSQAAVMFIASGKEYTLKGPADYLVKDTEIASSSGMPPTTRETPWHATGRVLAQASQASAASVRMRSIARPKAEAGRKLLYPTEGMTATLEPTFRWRDAESRGPSELTLGIVGEEKPVSQAKVSGTSHRFPAKLRPDTEYVWTVSVGGGEIGTAKFRTPSAEALNRIDQHRPAARAEFSDHVLFALMLQEMGAAQEAQATWSRLASERSDLPELAAFAK